MAIYQMLRTASFSPEDVERLATAYEDALQVLQIVNRADPITVVIAKRIIDAAKTGVRNSKSFAPWQSKTFRHQGFDSAHGIKRALSELFSR